jgi:hypothetical protein
MVYRFPYCNVSESVCWGNTSLHRFQVGQYQGLASIMDVFFGSAFNGDLDGSFLPYEKNGRTAYNTEDLFNMLDGEKEFPLDNLAEWGRFGEWLSMSEL